MQRGSRQIQPGAMWWWWLAVTAECTDGLRWRPGWPPVLVWRARGARALSVIDAGVRDVKTLTEMGFPWRSRAISSKGTIRATLASQSTSPWCA